MAKAVVTVVPLVAESERARISWRPFVFALFLIPVCAYWMARRGQDGIMSLGVPPIAFVFLLAMLNFPIFWLSSLHRFPV